jgi:hypothetical protein
MFKNNQDHLHDALNIRRINLLITNLKVDKRHPASLNKKKKTLAMNLH